MILDDVMVGIGDEGRGEGVEMEGGEVYGLGREGSRAGR